MSPTGVVPRLAAAATAAVLTAPAAVAPSTVPAAITVVAAPGLPAATLAAVAPSTVPAATAVVVAPGLPAATLAAAAPAPDGVETVFIGDFESGNTLGWSSRVPPEPAPDVYRAADLDLRDPHVFIDVTGFGCQDFTDVPAGGGFVPPLNDLLAAAVTADGDGDGLLDASVLLGFRPLDMLAAGERLDRGLGDCTAPLAGTVCDWRIPPVPVTTTYDGLAAGDCLAPHPGTTSGYLPAPAAPAAPCFTSAPREVALVLLDIEIELIASQVGAEFLGGPPPASLESGLLLGFLTEAAANSILLPADLPIVGGQPISVLLPGGAGNCAPGDDRDLHQGQSGWWFYFDLRAEPAPFVGD
jgi:hypothetical protein